MWWHFLPLYSSLRIEYSTPSTLITFNGNSSSSWWLIDVYGCVLHTNNVSQIHLHAFVVLYAMSNTILCERLTWWSNFKRSNKNETSQKIQIVMNQIKSTKRLTVDDFSKQSTRNGELTQKQKKRRSTISTTTKKLPWSKSHINQKKNLHYGC